jgi:hypothetical protein
VNEQLIAHAMAEAIVHDLEIIQITVEQRKMISLLPLAAVDALTDAIGE